MIQLAVIFAIGALGFAFAVSSWRWLDRRPPGDRDIAGTADRVSEGVRSFLRRQSVVALALAGVVGACVLVGYGVAYQAGATPVAAPREHGLWLTVSYLVGVGCGLGASWVSAWAARRAVGRVAAAAGRSLDESLQLGLRAGAVPGAAALALAVLGLGGLFLGRLITLGEGSLGGLPAPAALARADQIPTMLAGFALGAAFVALLAQLGGGTFGNVADIGADVAGRRLAEDADSPAAMADLVGDGVGDGAARASGLLSATALDLVAAMLMAALVYRDNAELPSVLALLLFPLVARAFGLLAAWFGVMVVRTDDTEVPMSALTRGLYVTTALYAVAALGSARWLLGRHWLAIGGAAVLGCVASLALMHWSQYYSDQRYRPVRSVADASRAGPTLATLRGLVIGLESTLVLLSALIALALGAYQLGRSSGLASGGLLGLAVAAGGMMGASPFTLAMETMGSIADAAGGIVGMTLGVERPDVRARARLLDAVGTTVKVFARATTAVVSALGSLLVACFVTRDVWRAGGSASFDVRSPALYLGAGLGLALVLAFFWVSLGRVVGGSRDLVHELRSQLGVAEERVGLGHAPPEGDVADRGERAGARQDACVELVARVALRSILPPVLVGVALPLSLGAGLRIVAKGDNVRASAEALVALLFAVTIAGALGTLLFSNAGSAWDNAKKYIETGAHGGRYSAEVDNPVYVAAAVGDTIGDPFKGVVGPASQALVATLATMAVVFLPFFL